MLSFILLVLACAVFAGAFFSQYFPPAPSPAPWYGRLVPLGLFLWSLSEVVARWPAGGRF